MTLFTLSDAEIDRLLAEDVPFGDLTTLSLGIGAEPGLMAFRARGAMTVSAVEEAVRLIERAGAKVTAAVASGASLEADAVILEAVGPASALLAGWKAAQTLVEVASGIASVTRAIVDAATAVAPEVVVACTRKTFPGTKAIAIKAVMAGGAIVHRLGLSETVLLFPEHRVFAPDTPLPELLARLKSRCPEKKIVVEVGNAEEALRAAEAGADVVQLEKFAPAAVARVVAMIGSSTLVAAAGGINPGNAAAYAASGARVLVTSAPYWAPPRDVAVSIGRRGIH